MTASTRPNAGESGFTLVEMLVALSVFALLAAGGVGILRASVDTQAAVETRLSELGGLGRLRVLLTSDLEQAVDRPARTQSGQRPAFSGEASGMEFVRGGRANLDGAPRSDLQRVDWRFDGKNLSRIGHSNLDGADGESHPADIARSIRGAALRYRSLDGSWSSAFQSSERQALPSAVELTLTPSAGEPVVIIFALPPTGSPEAAAAS